MAQDDDGNASHGASPLPIGGSVPEHLNSPSDIDAFRLDLPGRALVQVRR